MSMTCGGKGEVWERAWKKLRQELPFRKIREGEGEFVGSHLKQLSNFAIQVSQAKFAARVKGIKIPQGVADRDQVSAGILSQARGLLGAVTWLASQSRPDLQVLSSLGQQGLSKMTYGQARRLNTLVTRVKQHADLPITIPSIPPDQWELAGFSDAALQNASGGGTQAGSVVTLVRKGFGDGQEVEWAPLLWRSHRLPRVVVSKLSGETMALLETLGYLEWMACLLLEGRNPDFRVRDREKHYSQVQTWQVIDAKSVYDHLRSNNPQSGVDDRRTALDFLVAVESLDRLHCTLRWGPSGVQLGDVLTKDTADAADTWRAFLKRGRYRLASKEAALQLRTEERARRKEAGIKRQLESEQKQVDVPL